MTTETGRMLCSEPYTEAQLAMIQDLKDGALEAEDFWSLDELERFAREREAMQEVRRG